MAIPGWRGFGSVPAGSEAEARGTPGGQTRRQLERPGVATRRVRARLTGSEGPGAMSCNGHRRAVPLDRWSRSYPRAAVAPAMGSLREANFTKDLTPTDDPFLLYTGVSERKLTG